MFIHEIIQIKEDQHDDNNESENDPGNRRLTNYAARRFMLSKHDDAILNRLIYIYIYVCMTQVYNITDMYG